MQKQNSYNLPKFIITITIIFLIGTLFGSVFYLLKQAGAPDVTKRVNIEKLSDDKISNDLEDNKVESKTDTSDWKTYRNKEYGFELKYPLDFKEQKAESDTILLTTKIDKVSSNYFTVSIRKNYKINQILSSVKDVEEINIGDYLGYKYFYIEGVGMSEVVLIQTGQDALSISFDLIGGEKNFATADDKKTYIQDYFNQILSTFKFIEKNDELTYKYDWADENCSSFFTKGFGPSASNKKDCEKWIDFNNESVYYKFGKNENLGDYFCEKNKSIHSGYYFNSLSIGPTSLNCRIVKSNTGHENVMRNGYHCNRASCGPVMCGDMPEIESCKFRDVLIAYTSNIEYPIVVIGHNWGNNCFSNEDIKEINRLDFKSEYDELDILMQKKYEECKIKNESSINEFNNYINNFELYKK